MISWTAHLEQEFWKGVLAFALCNLTYKQGRPQENQMDQDDEDEGIRGKHTQGGGNIAS